MLKYKICGINTFFVVGDSRITSDTAPFVPDTKKQLLFFSSLLHDNREKTRVWLKALEKC